MRCSTLTLALLLLGVCAFAQQPLVPNKKWGNVNVSVDVNQLWNYNRYEGSRWGIGGEVNTPLKSDRQKPILAQRKLFLSAYGGWGYRDHGWKYGAKAGLRLPQGLMQRDLFVEYKHDLTLSGKIGDKDYQLFALGSTPGFFSSHYVAFDRLRVGCISGLFEQHFGLDYRYSREHYLFSPDTLLYPLLHEADALNPYYYTTTFHALHFFLSPQRAAWSLTLDMGHFASKMESGYYAKLLTEWDKKLYNKADATVRLYLRGGAVTPNAPYSRLFDLSGTAFAPLFFGNTFMTVRPNTFMAHAFAQANLMYESPKLWDKQWTHPRIVAQLNGMIGVARLPEGDSAYPLAAPNQGILEPLVGIDRLLTFGILDLGVAVACQLTPASADYHLPHFSDGITLLGKMSLVN